MNKVKILIISTIILIGCKEEFLLNSETYQPVLVIDGKITNENPPYIIKLSLSSPIDLAINIPLTNCNITLIENDIKSEQLTEINPGV